MIYIKISREISRLKNHKKMRSEVKKNYLSDDEKMENCVSR